MPYLTQVKNGKKILVPNDYLEKLFQAVAVQDLLDSTNMKPNKPLNASWSYITTIPHGKLHKKPPHHCDPLIPCIIHLSDIGKRYHVFPKGAFHVHYSPPAVPNTILRSFTTHPLTWSWTTKASPNTGKTFSIPLLLVTRMRVGLFNGRYSTHSSPTSTLRYWTWKQVGPSQPL